jgi:hypothetical protein
VREHDKVASHCFNGFIMRPDFAYGAIHTDEWRSIHRPSALILLYAWCGDSRQDLDAVSDFEITHNN